jgi:hypothetical protein
MERNLSAERQVYSLENAGSSAEKSCGLFRVNYQKYY